MTDRNAAIDRRVEHLGRLADRRKAAMQAGDLEELERIATEYLGCKQPLTQTAREIEIYVSLQRQNQTLPGPGVFDYSPYRLTNESAEPLPALSATTIALIALVLSHDMLPF